MPSVSSAKRKLEKWITEEAKTAIDEEVEDIKREIESGRIKELNKRKIINRLKSVMQDKIDELVSEASEASEVLSEGKMLKLGNTFYPASSLEREPLPTTLILPVLPAIAAVLSSKVITAIGATVAAGLGGYIIHDSWDDIKGLFGAIGGPTAKELWARILDEAGEPWWVEEPTPKTWEDIRKGRLPGSGSWHEREEIIQDMINRGELKWGSDKHEIIKKWHEDEKSKEIEVWKEMMRHEQEIKWGELSPEEKEEIVKEAERREEEAKEESREKAREKREKGEDVRRARRWIGDNEEAHAAAVAGFNSAKNQMNNVADSMSRGKSGPMKILERKLRELNLLRIDGSIAAAAIPSYSSECYDEYHSANKKEVEDMYEHKKEIKIKVKNPDEMKKPEYVEVEQYKIYKLKWDSLYDKVEAFGRMLPAMVEAASYNSFRDVFEEIFGEPPENF